MILKSDVIVQQLRNGRLLNGRVRLWVYGHLPFAVARKLLEELQTCDGCCETTAPNEAVFASTRTRPWSQPALHK